MPCCGSGSPVSPALGFSCWNRSTDGWPARSSGSFDARHVIYIVLIGFLLVYVFHLTQTISRMADQIQVLVSQLSIVEHELASTMTAAKPADT